MFKLLGERKYMSGFLEYYYAPHAGAFGLESDSTQAHLPCDKVQILIRRIGQCEWNLKLLGRRCFTIL